MQNNEWSQISRMRNVKPPQNSLVCAKTYKKGSVSEVPLKSFSCGPVLIIEGRRSRFCTNKNFKNQIKCPAGFTTMNFCVTAKTRIEKMIIVHTEAHRKAAVTNRSGLMLYKPNTQLSTSEAAGTL